MVLRLLSDAREIQDDGSTLAATALSLPDLPRALDLTQSALQDGARIGVFGDYDCDGITGAAILTRFLRRQGSDPVVRLPHRVKDGYGLKRGAVEAFLADGIRLLITVDTGIRSIDEIALAGERGMQVIVIDHHRPASQLPPAAAILHPALGSAPILPHPSGAGMALLFVEAAEHLLHGSDAWDDDASDRALAMIGTIADVVELRGANRQMTKRGLEALKGMTTGPLRALCDIAGCTGTVDASDVAFRIAPRINAAGRMDDPTIALSALLGDTDALRSLDRLNRDRQALTAVLWEEICIAAEDLRDRAFLCVASPAYPPGIVGLLAGRLTEKTGKPSMVGSVEGGTCVASLRSIPGYDVTEALARNADVLASFGGHAQAAGCSVPLSSFEQLSLRLHMDATLRIPEDERSPILLADTFLSPLHLSLQFCEALATLAPFGQGNPEPRFVLPGVLLTSCRPVGAERRHLQGRLGAHKVIGFNVGSLLPHTASPLDLLCRVQRDAWNGRESVQIVVDDMRIPEKVAVSIALA